MFGIIYIALCILAGWKIAEAYSFNDQKGEKGNSFWLLFPISFGCGTLLLTWSVYAVSYLAAIYGRARYPLFTGNFVVMSVTAVVLCFVLYNRKKEKHSGMLTSQNWIENKILFKKEVWFFSVLFLFVLFMMFYVFHISNGYLYTGYTVFSDYAPHTAMIRSFSMGNNFPTQYPHFGGEDVKYHFMFQFLVGNLEYLGLRIDFAYNLASAISLWSFLVLLYKIAARITGSCLAGAWTIVIFFFRSGLSFFRFAWEHMQTGDLWTTLLHNTAFIGYTPNENWGLWCFNVYLNQRHLAFGLLIVCIVIWSFLDYLEAGASHSEKRLLWLRDRCFSLESWKSKNWKKAVLLGMLLGSSAFWNGATVIGGLLILVGFALFSDGKLDYAAMALATILLSEVQSKLFVAGSVMQVSFRWGLLAEKPTLLGGLWFLVQMSGIYFIGMLVIGIFLNKIQYLGMWSFLLPLFFAFTISLTPDIAVNHKYVMMSYAFLGMFWGTVFAKIWRMRRGSQVAAVFMALCLMATGIYDFIIILKDNDSQHCITVNMQSDVTKWLASELSSEDLLLTPEYSINDVTMSGAMLYCGWPYYAWSAGYDTYRREAIAKEIYTTENKEQIQKLVEEENITYILFDEGMEIEGVSGREDVIQEIYPLVYQSESGRIRIYKV